MASPGYDGRRLARVGRMRHEEQYPDVESGELAGATTGCQPGCAAGEHGQAPHAAHNAAGQNSGSCKVFSFAQVEGLDATQTLALFAEHYRAVLATPQAQDHANIRNFMQHGFAGLRFAGVA